jgi:HK97 family phage major capsid protein
MSKSIQVLREKKTEISRAANELLASKGDQVWSAEDKAKFDGMMDEAERVQSQVDAHQKILDAKAAEILPKKDSEASKDQTKAAYDLFLRKSMRDMTADEINLVRNTMSTTTGSQGGYTVPSQISSDLVNALKDYGGMRRVASRIATSTGQTISFPTSDGTAEVGEIIGQNTTATASDPSFNTVSIGAFKWSSKVVAVPIELLQDSVIDVATFVQQRLRDRIGRIQNTKFTIGAGTTEPLGLTAAASTGKTGTTGQTTTIIYDDLVDMADSIDVAYLAEGPLKWMFGQSLRKVLRKLKDSQGRPIWTPGYEGGITQNTPDMLMGYEVAINNDMPTPAANAKSLAFGQLNKYLIRDTMEVTMFRFEDSAYMKLGQVGFLAWARSDGNLIDTNGVKLYVHSAT